MIKLTRLNGEEIVVNANLIEIVKSTPDTIIKLTTNKNILVKESVDEVVEKVIDYKRKVFNGLTLDEE
ncbi:MAG: flagellar FlbD family protein [Bacillota bacterium]